jgi:hypothetical protein
MIEKLNIDPTQSVVTNHCIINKINEIIDLLNAIVVDVDGTKCIDGSKKPEPAENVQVDEIEQAEKWIGKLCWFSQLYGCHQHIAILKRISESGLYVTDDGELHYAYCEPVKPTDSIIYKGGDNA